MKKVLGHRALWMATLVAMIIPISSATKAAESFAAFAVVPGQGAAYHGYGRGETASVARRAALDACRRKRCKVVQEYHQGQCAHVVLGTFQVFWNDTEFSKSHRAEVIAYCRKFDEGCRVLVSECL